MSLAIQTQQLSRKLAQIELWPVVTCIAASIIWPRLLPAAVATAAFFWIIRWIAYGRPSVRTPGDWAIILLVLMLPVTLWATALPDVTNTQVLRILTGIALYYTIVNWDSSYGRSRLLINSTIIAGMALTLSASFTVTWQSYKLPFISPEIYERFALLVTDTVHPNVMAGNILILFPIALCWVLFGWRELSWIERALSGFASTLMLVVIFLTQSRGAIAALIVAIILLPLLLWRRGWVLLLIGVLLITAGILLFDLDLITQKFIDLTSITGTEGRLETWARSIYMIQDFPFTGIGIGSYVEVLDTFYPFYPPNPESIFHAHNLFIQLAVDLGIPGLIAWLAIFFGIITISWQIFRYGFDKNSPLIKGVGAGLFCSQLALVMHGLTDAVTWGMVRPAPIVWALWGLAAASWGIYIGNTRSS